MADILPETQVIELLKDAVRRTYGKKGEDIDTASASVKLTNVRLLSDKKQ